jgi:hypothetical protein
MTAGVRFIPQAPRCGCCDRAEAFAVCEHCQEPTCVAHFVRVRSFEGAVRYVCTLCAEAMKETTDYACVPIEVTP